MSTVLKIKVASAERLRRGQEYLWTVMRSIDDEFSVGNVWKMTDENNRSTVATYMRKLEKHGFIERTGKSGANPVSGRPEPLYRIVKRQAAAPKFGPGGALGRQGLVNQNMWNVMRRQRGGWTALDLSILASVDDMVVSRSTALAYCTRLEQAGLLIVMDPGGPGKPRLWRLRGSADTGPRPPMILRSKLVFDQNTARVVGDLLAEEEQS